MIEIQDKFRATIQFVHVKHSLTMIFLLFLAENVCFCLNYSVLAKRKKDKKFAESRHFGIVKVQWIYFEGAQLIYLRRF